VRRADAYRHSTTVTVRTQRCVGLQCFTNGARRPADMFHVSPIRSHLQLGRRPDVQIAWAIKDPWHMKRRPFLRRSNRIPG